MEFSLIAAPEQASELRDALGRATRLALDCEAAGFHRYSDQLCLVQITVDGCHFVVDPLGFDVRELLAGPLQDPDVQILMHGSDYDLRLLDRDLGIRPRNLFDTQVAATLLGETRLGLSALLEKHLDVRLSKKYQRADWASRPLSDDMLEYAVHDTAHLHGLVDLLDAALRDAGRRGWADEEFALLEEIQWVDPPEEDPVARIKAARKLPVRQVARLRALLDWRDGVAREMDRAPFRVADNRVLVELALDPPASVADLRDRKGFSNRLADRRGEEILERIGAVDAEPEDALEGFPRRPRGPGRPPPEVETVVDRLKDFRNRKADELELPRGTLFPNASLLAIAEAQPGSMDELAAVDGLRRWQVEVAGQELLGALASA